MTKKENTSLKKGVIYIYLSVIIHCYVLFMILAVLDPAFLRALEQMVQNRPKQETAENVIIDTQFESETAPDKGKLSDKPNQDLSPVKGKNDYNYLNLTPGKVDRPPAVQMDASKQDAKKDNSEAEVTLDGGEQAKQKNGGKPSEYPEPSDRHTSFYEPEKKIDVTMDNYGDISLATVPKKYASYFIEMQKKIGNNWKEFFPVFQYYQGIIKSGDVVVQFQIDTDGSVRNARVVKSYGYTILDESSLNAVNYSKNFGPLPGDLKSMGPINIHFRFIYIAR